MKQSALDHQTAILFPTSLRMGIFILLWISLTFNLESNEMYSYFFFIFYFLQM